MINVVENNPYRILGVYANSPKRDILANEGKIKAFLKVGKAVSFPLDLNGLLPNASRTETSVVQAKSYLSLPQDQLKYAMFWFLNITPIDKIAFNHLFAGNMDEAVELWKKKECLSSLQNRMMCYLIKGKNVYAAGVADRLYFKYGSDFCNLISPTLKLGHEDFVNKFFDTLEGEMNVDLSSFSWERCSQLWKDTLNGRLVSPVISQIEACINKAKSVQRNSPSARYDAGVTLMNGTKPLIVKLKNVCASSDMRYQNVMDKLANEILQCGIDYYNGSEDDDKGEKAMPLQKYALQIAVGPMAKSRCQENVDILQRNIDNLPPMEVMANHKAIQLALKKFVAQPELIEYSIQLIKECAPHIVAIKEKLGRNNQYYLKISTAIVNNALGNVVSEVNEAQKKDFRVLKATLISAWRTQLYMDMFDLEPEYKDGRFKENRSALHSIIKDCKGFEKSSMSFMYQYGCGWCNNLVVSDVDLRTDDEFFASCRTRVLYRAYLRKFPTGKHVSEAKSKIVELSFNECKTLADYQQFLIEYPNSVYQSKALAAIDRLRREEEEKRIKTARQEKAISACVTLNEVLTLYAKEKSEDIDIDKCSDRAFELAELDEDFNKVLSTFGERSSGGKKAKTKIEELERCREEKAKARKKAIRMALLIGIPILVLVFIYIIWGVAGLSATCGIIAFLSGCCAMGAMKSDDGCGLFFIFAAIAAVFGLACYGLDGIADSVDDRNKAKELYEQIINAPTDEACSSFISRFGDTDAEKAHKVRGIWLNMLMNEAQNFMEHIKGESSSSYSTLSQTTNPLQKIQDFVEQNNNTFYQDKAETFLKNICDSLYDVADRSNTVLGWRQYQRVVPTNYFWDSDDKIAEIENQSWNTDAKAWRQATLENSISAYEKYKSMYPNGAHISACEKKLIDLEVSRVFQGEHGTLPAMERTGYGGGSTSYITVTNNTSYTLTIWYSGNDSKKLVIGAGGTKSVRLKNGQYKVAASVSASNVSNYAGIESLHGGNYSADYYIRTYSY